LYNCLFSGVPDFKTAVEASLFSSGQYSVLPGQLIIEYLLKRQQNPDWYECKFTGRRILPAYCRTAQYLCFKLPEQYFAHKHRFFLIR
jgi:hypothetical protein